MPPQLRRSGALAALVFAVLVATVYPPGTPAAANPNRTAATVVLTAVAVSSTQIDLSWTNVRGNVDYALYRKDPAGDELLRRSRNRTYAHTGLRPGTTYSYQVVVEQRGREGGRSAVVSATTAPLATSGTGEPAATEVTADPTVVEQSPGTSGTSTSTGCAGVQLRPGDSIQQAVDAHPAGTTFCLAAGTYRRQHVRPKHGNSFIGEPGAVLDGEGAATLAFDRTADHVTIRGLTIQHYANPAQVGAIQAGGHNPADSRTGWVVEDNVVQRNAGMGIRIGSDMVVRNNRILRNEQLGIGGIGDRTVVEGNEIAYNNPNRAFDPGWEAGGSKFVLTNDLVVRGNHVHSNVGPGLWTDWRNTNTLYEQNLVEGNTGEGIFHEVSYAATIRHNTVRRNGLGHRSWCYGSGILVAHSSDVTVQGNVVEDNWNGITAIQQARGDHKLRNLHVTGNTIVVTQRYARDGSGNGAYAAAVCDDTGDTSVFTSSNNRFTANSYRLVDADTGWWEWRGRRTWSGWRGIPQDSSGSLQPA